MNGTPTSPSYSVLSMTSRVEEVLRFPKREVRRKSDHCVKYVVLFLTVSGGLPIDWEGSRVSEIYTGTVVDDKIVDQQIM